MRVPLFHQRSGNQFGYLGTLLELLDSVGAIEHGVEGITKRGIDRLDACRQCRQRSEDRLPTRRGRWMQWGDIADLVLVAELWVWHVAERESIGGSVARLLGGDQSRHCP